MSPYKYDHNFPLSVTPTCSESRKHNDQVWTGVCLQIEVNLTTGPIRSCHEGHEGHEGHSTAVFSLTVRMWYQKARKTPVTTGPSVPRNSHSVCLFVKKGFPLSQDLESVLNQSQGAAPFRGMSDLSQSIVLALCLCESFYDTEHPRFGHNKVRWIVSACLFKISFTSLIIYPDPV